MTQQVGPSGQRMPGVPPESSVYTAIRQIQPPLGSLL
jgi:hypothetical protein